MHNFQPVPEEYFKENPFEMIGKQWMLITAMKDNKVNTMTASWGGLGVMWGKDVAYVVIRNSRYTKEFVDAADTFSLCFFDEKYRQQLKYIGSVSGRDENKIAATKLKVQLHEGTETPFFDEASLVLICRKMYAGQLDKENFVCPDIQEKWYKDEDYHVLYIGEVTRIMAR